MLNILKKYYLGKVNELYKYVSEHIDDAIMLRNFIDYHKDMLAGMDKNIVNTTGPLDAIFFFYQKDYKRTLEFLKNPKLTELQVKQYEEVAFADKSLMDELSEDGVNVNPYYNELVYNMMLLEKFNNKLDFNTRMNLDELYTSKRVLK